MTATGSTVFIVEIQALQKLLAERDGEIERLKGLQEALKDVLAVMDEELLMRVRHRLKKRGKEVAVGKVEEAIMERENEEEYQGLRKVAEGG